MTHMNPFTRLKGKLSLPKKNVGAWMKWIVSIILLAPVALVLLALAIYYLRWAGPFAVDKFHDSVTGRPLMGATHEAPLDLEPRPPVDPSELRMDHYIVGPSQWGWQTLPTEVEGMFPIDAKVRYTGLNVALLQGSKITASSPGYDNDNSYLAWIHAGPSNPVSIDRSGEEFRVNGLNNTSGALMIEIKPRRREAQSLVMPLTFEVAPLPGHTRIATWKEARGGPTLKWGQLPDPGTYSWNLYVRFADKDGITLTPSVIQQYPAIILVGKKDHTDGTLVPTIKKTLSEAERVFGNNIVQEQDSFLTLMPPNIPGQKVRIEVILDIEH